MAQPERLHFCLVAPEGLTTDTGGLDRLRQAAEEVAEGQFLWAQLDDPDGPTLAETLKALGLDGFGAKDGRAEHRRPKVDIAHGTYLVVLKTLWYIEGTKQVETGDLVFYTDGRAAVTVRRGEGDPVSPTRRRIAADPGLRSNGPLSVAAALAYQVVGEYAEAIDTLEDDVEAIELTVFSGNRTDCIAQIYSLIRETLEFQNAVGPLVPVANQALRWRTGLAPPVRTHVRELAEHLLRISTSVDTCMNLLTTVLTAHQGQIGTWQNEDMRKISAWAAIAVVPTAIAGIYGMNFDHMPELHWLFGYPLVLLVMAGICLALYRGFRRNGWLLSG